jgi:hypothetical protein
LLVSLCVFLFGWIKEFQGLFAVLDIMLCSSAGLIGWCVSWFFGEGCGLKCPICSKKLDFDAKEKSAVCHSCGWRKVLSRVV